MTATLNSQLGRRRLPRVVRHRVSTPFAALCLWSETRQRGHCAVLHYTYAARSALQEPDRQDRARAPGGPDGNGCPEAYAPLNASAAERISESNGAAERFNGAAERINRPPTLLEAVKRSKMPRYNTREGLLSRLNTW